MPNETGSYQFAELAYHRCKALGEYAQALAHIDSLIDIHREFSSFGLAELRAERERLLAIVNAQLWEKDKSPFVKTALRALGFGPRAVRL